MKREVKKEEGGAKERGGLPWRFLFGLALFVLLLVFLGGWRGHIFRSPPFEFFSDMVRQPRISPQAPSQFFADGRGDRPPVPGTVPLGFSIPQYSSLNGKNGSAEGPYSEIAFGKGGKERIPLEVNAALMQRGQERFSIHCAVCHGATGQGNGIATQYGLVGVANLQLARIRSLSDKEIFRVITDGKNLMMPLGAKIPVSDRWAIVVYLRALQRSQQTGLEDVPNSERLKLEALP